MLASVLSAPIGGSISDRIGKRKAVALLIYAIMTASMFIAFTDAFAGWTIPAFMIVFGIFGGPIAAILLASVPEVSKSPMLIGIGMGCVAVCQNLGMFLGPTLFMGLVAGAEGGVDVTANWLFANYVMIAICIIGMLCIWRVKVR
jgi:MFS family permease